MNCKQVCKLLSEYLENELDQKTRKQIKQHLTQCPSCSRELAALKKYHQSLSSLGSVKPPADFLNRLHARIEQPSFITRTLRTLFRPLKVKLTLELAGLMTTMLIILIILPVHKKTTSLKSIKENEETTKSLKLMENKKAYYAKDMTGRIRSSGKGEKISRSLDIKDQIKTAAEEEKPKPLELVLLIKTQLSDEYDQSEYYDEAVTLDKNGEKETKKSREDDKAASGQPQAPATTALEKQKVKQETRQQHVTLPSSHTIFSNIKNAVLLAGGTIIEKKVTEKSGLPDQITVEIPAKNYRIFLSNLRNVGELQGPIPTVSKKEKRMIQNQIQLEYSK